jgi:hypothetical protein
MNFDIVELKIVGYLNFCSSRIKLSDTIKIFKIIYSRTYLTVHKIFGMCVVLKI